jgi:hypothetical protein
MSSARWLGAAKVLWPGPVQFRKLMREAPVHSVGGNVILTPPGEVVAWHKPSEARGLPVSSPVIPAPHGNQIHADVTTVTSFN